MQPNRFNSPVKVCVYRPYGDNTWEYFKDLSMAYSYVKIYMNDTNKWTPLPDFSVFADNLDSSNNVDEDGKYICVASPSLQLIIYYA